MHSILEEHGKIGAKLSMDLRCHVSGLMSRAHDAHFHAGCDSEPQKSRSTRHDSPSVPHSTLQIQLIMNSLFSVDDRVIIIFPKNAERLTFYRIMCT